LERFVPEDRQEWTDEEGSQNGSAHGGQRFSYTTHAAEDLPTDTAHVVATIQTTRSTTTTFQETMAAKIHRQKEADDILAADELLAIQMAEQCRRDIMDAEVVRWLQKAPFPDDFDINFENLLAHGLISPDVLETLDQVDPRWLNPKYRYVEEETEDQKAALEADLTAASLESMKTLPLNLTSNASASSSMDQTPPKQEDKPSPCPPKATEPEGLVALAICGICNRYYRPAENPLVSTLASPSSLKSPYFDPNQASPFPFGLDLYCPSMHGSCIDCMEKHIVDKLQMGSRMAFPVRCPACVKEENEQGMEYDDNRPVKGWAWEVQDSLAEKVLGPRSMEVWRERKDQ
ncbi:hypothetical protein FRC00_010638, partial [Tulasnella sp. 408]